MELIEYPPREKWEELCRRPRMDVRGLEKTCREVFSDVEKNGDEALMRYTERFDRVRVENPAVGPDEFAHAETLVPVELKKAITAAKANIEAFHKLQMPAVVEYTSPAGFTCRQEPRPIEKVGLYIPGGSAPLFSTVLMLAVPAAIAGCRETVLCTPPSPDGSVNPAVLWTAALCGVSSVFKAGGIQAVAAMTFGTDSIPAVYKIFGPGNQYVMAAKQLAASSGVAIDMPAGPSEVLVVADGTADARYVAADLLSQAEHGPDSQVVLLATGRGIAEKVGVELERQLALLPRRGTACRALANSRTIVLESVERCIEFSNEYAPEHLILSVEDAEKLCSKVISAGSVFLGNYSPESAGDYASGTNHTLPTSAYARAYSGVNMDSFMKKVTFQNISREGLEALAPAIMAMARAEGLEAHRAAVSVRLEGGK